MIRSGVIFGRRCPHESVSCASLQVIYMASIDSQARQDAQMTGSQLRFVAADDAAKRLGASLGVAELEVCGVSFV